MQDPGLNHRLQQRSRRSGFMIGLTMALTLAVCVGSFTMIYAQLEPVVSDFVSGTEQEDPTAPPLIAQAQETQAPAGDDTQAAPQSTDEPAEEPTTEPAENEDPEPTTAPTPEDENDEEFDPDYQLDSAGPVNLRPGPGVDSGPPVVAVPVEAPLMYLGESEPTQDPGGDGLDEDQDWMLFQTEDGEEGWIREIDVEQYTP